MEYRITEESLEAAIEYATVRNMISNVHILKTLCVPMEMKNNWIQKNNYPHWDKGYYYLEPSGNEWTLWQCAEDKAGLVASYHHFCCIKEAQVWADQQIKEYEAKTQPKPIGPGSRFRLPNGDEVVILEDSDIKNAFCIANLSTFKAMRLQGSFWHQGINNILPALQAAGAILIP